MTENTNNSKRAQNKILEKSLSRDIRRALKMITWQKSPSGKIASKVSESLDDASQEKITKYLDWLYGNISSSIQTIKQGTALILALMTAFELIANSSSTASVTIFSVGIPRHSIIAQIIPAVVAFLYLQLCRDSFDINKSRIAFSRAFQLWSEQSAVNGLDEYIWPSSRLYWDPFEPAESKISANSGPTVSWIWFAFEGMFWILTHAFLGQAYYVLFVPHLSESLALWAASLFFTLFCLWAGSFVAWQELDILGAIRTMRMVTRELEKDIVFPSDSPSD